MLVLSHETEQWARLDTEYRGQVLSTGARPIVAESQKDLWHQALATDLQGREVACESWGLFDTGEEAGVDTGGEEHMGHAVHGLLASEVLDDEIYALQCWGDEVEHAHVGHGLPPLVQVLHHWRTQGGRA